MNEAVKEAIRTGKTALGIEFGSTRIKAVLVDGSHAPIAMGTYDWENRLENNIWTYSLEDIWKGLQGCYKSLTDDVEAKYGEKLTTLGSLGFSGMMHGYMPFNAAGELLVPFRTWRNTQTSEACKKLIPVFNFNIPQRWSIAHLYQAILNEEEHVKDVAFFTTLAGYIHWKLSGEKVLGVGEASGMFPIDIATGKFVVGFNTPGVIAHSEHLWNILGMYTVGFAAVLAGGCPLRQLILAGEGNTDSAVTVLGLMAGAAFAHNFGLASSGEGPTANGKIAVIIGIVVVAVIAAVNSMRKEEA